MNKVKMKVSFIIPVYNGGKTIKDTLDSVLIQKVSKEVIVVDNNSKDKTREIVKRYKNKGVILSYEKKQGSGACRNKALGIAKGEFIAFVDADVILPKNWLKIALKKLKKKGIAGVGGPCKSPNKDIVSQSLNIMLYGLKKSDKDIITQGVANMAALYKREAIGNIKFDERLLRSQDSEFNLHIMEKGYKFLRSSKLMVLHIHPIDFRSLIKKWFMYGQYYPLPALMHSWFIGKFFILRHVFLVSFIGFLIWGIFNPFIWLFNAIEIVLLYVVYFLLGLRNLGRFDFVLLLKFSFIHSIKQISQLVGMFVGYARRLFTTGRFDLKK